MFGRFPAFVAATLLAMCTSTVFAQHELRDLVGMAPSDKSENIRVYGDPTEMGIDDAEPIQSHTPIAGDIEGDIDGGGCSDCGLSCANPGGWRCGPWFVNGWLDQGYTWNPDNPRDRFNTPVTFNDRANEYQMNQLYLSMGREVNTDACQWDLGGRVDLLYGTDYFFTQATGLETHPDGSPKWNSANGPRGAGAALYGLAMPQLYAELYAPIGNGLTVKMGHFYSILGQESVMAPANFFYSHSYAYQYGMPQTATGMLARYDLGSNVAAQAGFTRGWNNWDAENDDIGFLGGVTWWSCDERTTLSFAIQTGNEPVGRRLNRRTDYTLVLTHALSCRWNYVLEHTLGTENEGAENGHAEWYGLVNYLYYRINPNLDAGLRYEWFHDDDGARVLSIPLNIVEGGSYNELTLGLNWRPCRNVTVRPEVRWDWSDAAIPAFGVDGPYDDFTKKSQFLAALDLVYKF